MKIVEKVLISHICNGIRYFDICWSRIDIFSIESKQILEYVRNFIRDNDEVPDQYVLKNQFGFNLEPGNFNWALNRLVTQYNKENMIKKIRQILVSIRDEVDINVDNISTIFQSGINEIISGNSSKMDFSDYCKLKEFEVPVLSKDIPTVINWGWKGIFSNSYNFIFAKTHHGKTMILCKLIAYYYEQGKKILGIFPETSGAEALEIINGFLSCSNISDEISASRFEDLKKQIVIPKKRYISRADIKTIIEEEDIDILCIDSYYELALYEDSNNPLKSTNDWLNFALYSIEIPVWYTGQSVPDTEKRTITVKNVDPMDAKYNKRAALAADTNIFLHRDDEFNVTMKALKTRHLRRDNNVSVLDTCRFNTYYLKGQYIEQGVQQDVQFN